MDVAAPALELPLLLTLSLWVPGCAGPAEGGGPSSLAAAAVVALLDWGVFGRFDCVAFDDDRDWTATISTSS